MKSTLIMAIVDVIFAIAMVVCIIFDIIMGNWPALLVCAIALYLNVTGAIDGFKRWRAQKAIDNLSVMARCKYSDLDN